MNQPTPVAEARRTEISVVREQLEGMLGQFATVLPPHISAKQFARVTLTAIQNNRELLECERLSLWNACMRAAQDGLLPDGRHGAMVVFKDRKRGIKTAQWMVMIAGLRQKIRNSGEVATLDVEVVRERDQYEYRRGDDPRIDHTPVRGPRGAVIAAYSIAKLKSGEISREWMWVEEIEEVRKRSRAADSGPWVTDYGEMCKKTVARRHSKTLPMSTDVLGLINREDEFVAPLRAEVSTPPEPRALSDALNLLSQKPDEPGDAQPPFDPDTGELAEEAEGHEDGLQAQGELIEQRPQQARQPEGTHETDTPPEDKERLRHITLLNDAAATGMLDKVYLRFSAKWQRELEEHFKTLKAGAK